MNEVWVYIEQDNGKIADVSLELLSKGKELAMRLQARLSAVLLGHNVGALPQILFSHGTDRTYLVDHEALKVFQTLPYARNVIKLAQKYQPRIILVGASMIGRDLAPRISSALKCGLTADCTALDIQDLVYKKENFKDLLLQTRPAFGGNIIATIISPNSKPEMATVREGVMELQKPDLFHQGEIITDEFIPSPDDSLMEIIERVKFDKKVNLKKADIIVSIGAGVGNTDNLKLVQQLAKTINGQIGASRAAVEKGLLSRDHQVGQTGITVRPKLYIACGISGAIQHRAGMDQAGTIIAFNKDPNAPIIKIAHYAIVGDLKQTIPMFIEAYKRKVSK